MFRLPPTQDDSRFGATSRLDFFGVWMCVLLLAVPQPGAARLITLGEFERPPAGEEETRQETAAGYKRLEERIAPSHDPCRTWTITIADQRSSANRATTISSVPDDGHRLSNGHNAPLSC